MDDEVAPPGYEFSEVFENGDVKRILVPVYSSEAAAEVQPPQPRGRPRRSAPPTNSGKRKSKGEGGSGIGKRRAKEEDDVNEELEQMEDDEERESAAGRRRSRSRRSRVAGATEQAADGCGRALGEWATLRIPAEFWEIWDRVKTKA